jgi:sigma-54 dependent transcriptional regulator, acetoin dehydrogenase operon transcriptional activator AcoR
MTTTPPGRSTVTRRISRTDIEAQEAESACVWTLRVLRGPEELGPALVIPAGRQLRIGREESTGVDIVLSDPRVSRVHADLLSEPGNDHLVILDRKSSNGVFLNGHRVTRAEVRAGDMLRLGDAVLVLGDRAPPGRDEEPDLGLLGASTRIADLRRTVRRVAPSALSAFLVGPTGTGKELVARAIHRESGRSGPFIAVNCAALPQTLFESTLFGHRKGSFTGASTDQDGAFVQAHGGTLFLDEVGEMAIEAQPRLLRALETLEITPVGAARSTAVDVRIVAATNVVVEAALREGKLRGDLYARLAGVVIRTPPLHHRREDIVLLFRSFFAPTFAARPMTADFVESLVSYSWPHNVRELRRLAERLQVLHPDAPRWERRMLDEEMREPRCAPPQQQSVVATLPPERPAEPERGPPSREELLALLASCDGNVSLAAARVGRNRKQVYRWMEQYGVLRGTGR